MKKIFLSLTAILSLTYLTSCSSDDNNGSIEEPTKEEVLSGTIAANRTLDANTVYTIKGAVYVDKGVTLTIPAGTRLEGYAEEDATDTSFLAVKQGGKIDARGTAAKPIVMTSSKSNPAAGNWGGLVICGNAITNLGKNVQAEVTGLTYGGDNPADNSGVYTYIRIEYAGALINPEAEFNGMTFYAVGNGTTVNNILTYQGSDDGFEWFGGSVNAENLMSIGNQDDSFDWTEGWNGKVTNMYASQATATAYSSDSRGIEADNNSKTPNLAPISNPTLKNVTLIGRNSPTVTSEAGVMLRRGTKATIDNLYIEGFKSAIEGSGLGIDFNGNESQAYFTLNPLTNVKIVNVSKDSNLPAGFKIGTNVTGAGAGAAIPTWAAWTGLK
ncbi:hypothetical protein [Empedobacter brevis]|uniref:hypothetical protein n=1 Tax=Empedobacter brevis TaxID=247 RepID=UPI0028A58286|nr:hypothetical protein [Empedobacter brevis]